MMMNKREIFRQCFDDFDFDKIAAYDEEQMKKMLETPGMIRSPRKVNAIINNARCFQEIKSGVSNTWAPSPSIPTCRPAGSSTIIRRTAFVTGRFWTWGCGVCLKVCNSAAAPQRMRKFILG